MMNIPTIFLLSVLAGCSGVVASAAADEGAPPSLNMTWHDLQLMKDDPDGGGKPEWRMTIGWNAVSGAGWEIEECDEGKTRVTMEDSTGRKAPDVRCICYLFDRECCVLLATENWLPSPGAQWVRVKGEVPFVVSRQEAVTEPVAVKLVKDFSVPLVLKSAVVDKDGRAQDLKARLVVEEYRDLRQGEDREWKSKKALELTVVSDEHPGIHGFELSTKDGLPVQAHQWMQGTGSRGWSMEPPKEGELQVKVSYAQHLKRCDAVLDGKVSLAGWNAAPARNGGRDGVSTVGSPVGAGRAASVIKASPIGLKTVNRQVSPERDEPGNMIVDIELAAPDSLVFAKDYESREQELDVTDSTGRALEPAVVELTWVTERQNRNNGGVCTSLEAKSTGLPSPGASWVRLKGVLRVPVAVMKASPAYELPLAKDAELQIPVPGVVEEGGDGNDVAQVGDAPTGRLWLKDMEQEKNGDLTVGVSLEVREIPFDLDSFELVDEQDVPLKDVDSRGGGSSGWGGEGADLKRSWRWCFVIKKTVDVKKLRIRLKYRADKETVNVPVDCTVGLGGAMQPQPVGKPR